MTPEEQQIAIAEACGWKKTPQDDESHQGWGSPAKFPYYRYVHQLPNYPKDLNAMHEAEKILTKEQQYEYCDALYRLRPVKISHLTSYDLWCFFVGLTSRQKAEAFLKTIGKWHDKKPS